MSRNQLNVRVGPEVEAAIDAKRVALSPELKRIPSRSEIVRFALEAYLGMQIEADGDGAAPSIEQKKFGRTSRSRRA
jgi:Arc/MetJ-type ribon-helix-helix transcriptional regulator